MNYVLAFNNLNGFVPPVVHPPIPIRSLEAPLDDADIVAHPSALPDDAMVDTRTAAAIVGLSKSSLEKKRSFGGGPVFSKYSANGAVRYRVGDLRRWIRTNSAASTGEHWASV